MEEYLLVSSGLNIQKFERNSKFDLNEHEDLLNGLDIFPTGEICGVRKDLIKDILEEPEISEIRNGLKFAPKDMKVESPEDFLRVVAIYIDIEEY